MGHRGQGRFFGFSLVSVIKTDQGVHLICERFSHIDQCHDHRFYWVRQVGIAHQGVIEKKWGSRYR